MDNYYNSGLVFVNDFIWLCFKLITEDMFLPITQALFID